MQTMHLWVRNATHGDDAASGSGNTPIDDIQSGVSAAFLVDGFVYALLAGGALVQLVRNCWRYRPWTVQKMLHLLMFVATVVRSVFLMLVGLDWCDVLTGKIKTSTCSPAERNLFYMMDQLPIILFFAIYALLVQFWAEVYFNAIDRINALNQIVKPAIRIGILAVFVMQTACWALYATKWRSERSFFAKAQANINMLLFTVVSAAFIVFGRLAYVELRSVPVELGIRSRKLKELAIMTTICSSCFMTRSGLQIFLSRQHLQLHDRSTWFIMLMYYALLEIIPSVTILYFNRRRPLRRGRPGANSSRTSTPISGDRGVGSRLFFFKDSEHDAAADPLRKSLLDDTK